MGWVGWVVQLITLSIPTWVEVELGCDNNVNGWKYCWYWKSAKDYNEGYLGRYSDFESACELLGTRSLQLRRSELSLAFALNCLKNPIHQHLFKQRKSTYYTLRKIKSFEEPFCRTERYKSSPLPFLTRLLNDHFSRK